MLCALLSALRHAAAKQHKPDPAVARVLPPPTPRTDGAIYQAGQQMELFADLKARRVGDVLTIRADRIDQCQQERGDQDREDHRGQRTPGPRFSARPSPTKGVPILDTTL